MEIERRVGRSWSPAPYLRELELLQLQLLHDVVPNDVRSSKYPASTAALLVRYRPGLEVDNVVEDMLVGNPCGARRQHRSDVALGQYSPRKLNLRVRRCVCLPGSDMSQAELSITRQRLSELKLGLLRLGRERGFLVLREVVADGGGYRASSGLSVPHGGGGRISRVETTCALGCSALIGASAYGK